MKTYTSFINNLDLRKRLSKIKFYDPINLSDNDNLEYCYSQEEITNHPIKWLKYLLLDKSGIESIKKIENQIHRYKIDEIPKAKLWIFNRIKSANKNGNNIMIVAKLVPWDQGAQLDNFRIFTIEDISKQFKKINKLKKDAHELWCCESDLSTSGLNLGGRISFPYKVGIQNLELVWYASPRFIEKFKLKEFEYPYLRAWRELPNPIFNVSIIQIPEYYQDKFPDHIWYDDFNNVMFQIDLRIESMQYLTSSLNKFGAKEVCFCFKVVNGQLTIIDWDTEIESTSSD